MSRVSKILAMVCVGVAALAALPASAQNFGAAKEKVLLQRKLPAIVRLPGNSIKVDVSGGDSDGALSYDFQALLETELLKDDPDLREDSNPNEIITCRITDYSGPVETDSTAPGISLTKGAPATQQLQRWTGLLTVAFQARTPDGRTLISDNVTSKYDEQFDGSGISTSHGIKGSLSGTWGKLKGQKSDENSPPNSSEIRSRLILDVVQQIAEHIVNTNETIEVFLAKGDGALDEGDKDAQAGLWERALETFETAQPSSKPEEDAYRLYDIGAAYEALAYQADDQKATMKYLDQAAINYGKAIDAKPSEKYFVLPQKRIETAIAHYKQLEMEQAAEQRAKAAAQAAANAPPPTPAEPAAKGLNNAQVVTMVKSGIDDSTIIQAIHGADAVNFDLTPAGERALTSGGVSARVIAVMKTQASKRSVVAKEHKGLSNTQIITMVKAGMDDDSIVQAIHGADAIDFDLSPNGQRQLTSAGVSNRILSAMKARAIRRPTAYARPVAER